jgi:hypothetical protein
MCPDIFLPFEHAARCLALTNRTWCPVRQRVTVGRILRAEIPALYNALEALALGAACNIDLLTLLKSFDCQLRAHLEGLI